MYLAREKIKGATHYYIRESYQDGATFLSRDLFDLGTDPAEYIIYAGGNAFYIDAAVEEHLDNLGVTPQGADLEDIFWRFLDSDIQPMRLSIFGTEKNVRKKKINPKRSWIMLNFTCIFSTSAGCII